MEKKKKFVNFKEISEKAALKEKMDQFFESSKRCDHFKWKVENSRTRIAWCYLLNKGCKYCRCPKIKHDD